VSERKSVKEATVFVGFDKCRRSEIPAPRAASPHQEFQIEKRH
jgi:hypothetical protein